MDFDEILTSRRSCRCFTDEEPNRLLVASILESGIRAPSAKNIQPWDFVVTRGREKDEIARILEDASQACGAVGCSIRRTVKIIHQAPWLVLVFPRVKFECPSSDYQSIGACIENMCLKATELGLGSLWICDVDAADCEIMRHFNREYPIVAAIAIGYAADNPPERAERLSIDDLVEWRDS